MRSVRLATLCLLVCGPAWAQMPPTFDMVGWCQADVASGAFPEAGLASCVANEQRKARSLRMAYRKIPAEIRAACEAFTLETTEDRGSYAVLDFCITLKQGH